jgi:hypothetical protein
MTQRSLPSSLATAITIALLGIVACQHRDSTLAAKPGNSASASAPVQVPLDHLRPGELAESAQQVFGFPIPRGMSIERAFPDAAHLVGEVNVSELATYVSKHAQVGAPELTATLLRFDRARIPSQGEQRQYRFDISQHGRQVQLLVKDVTPAPTQPGLTEEERWRQAGLKPNGAPLDIADLR